MEFLVGCFVAKHDVEKGLLELVYEKEWSSLEFRSGLQKALDYAAENSLKLWVLDLSCTVCLNDEEEGWFLSSFLPQMMLKVGLDNYMALVLPAACYEELLLQVGEVGLKSYNSFVIINTFCDRIKALKWLEEDYLLRAS